MWCNMVVLVGGHICYMTTFSTSEIYQFLLHYEVSRIDCSILQFKTLLEPSKLEGHINGTAQHTGAEHVLQDVGLLD